MVGSLCIPSLQVKFIGRSDFGYFPPQVSNAFVGRLLHSKNIRLTSFCVCAVMMKWTSG